MLAIILVLGKEGFLWTAETTRALGAVVGFDGEVCLAYHRTVEQVLSHTRGC